MSIRFLYKKIGPNCSRIDMCRANNIFSIGHSIFNIRTNEAIINNLFINKHWRGNNYGSLLLKKTEQIIRVKYPLRSSQSLFVRFPVHTLPDFITIKQLQRPPG